MILLDRVRRFVAQHQLAGRDTRVVVALSGGSDSVALAHLVRALDAAGDLRAAGLIHFNHQLRDTAVRDEEFSTRLAGSFGWPIVVEREDVAARARSGRQSLERAAHTARYLAFERARVALAADVVALGHTRDDQAETLLLRLVRGAGLKGLSGMHPRHQSVIRPLLSSRRHELRQFLADSGIAFVDDETNRDVRIPRNRVRAELLPLLERRFNTQIVDVLAHEAELARETWLWMEEQARDLRPGTSDQSLDIPRLIAAAPAVRRFVVWEAVTAAAGGRPVTFDHVQAVLELLDSDATKAIDLPGHSVQRLGLKLVLTRRDGAVAHKQRAATNYFDYPLSIPGEVTVPEAGCTVTAEAAPAGTVDLAALKSSPNTAAIRLDLCRGPWRVRNRRPGDRFQPFGLEGNKKLQDYFVDRKVPRHRRDNVPLVVDKSNRILWVAGFGIDEAFRVTDPAQAVVMLKVKLLGGSA